MAFKNTFEERMDADYGLENSENTATEATAVAEKFNKRIKAVIDKSK
jgi:hypothetical protein